MVVRRQVASDQKGASLRMFNIEVWLQLLPILAFLLTFFLLMTVVPVSNLLKRTKLIGQCLFEIDFTITRSMNAISFIALFYLIYFMIFKSIISNNIKTNSLMVNTSELIDDKEDLLRTKRLVQFNGRFV